MSKHVWLQKNVSDENRDMLNRFESVITGIRPDLDEDEIAGLTLYVFESFKQKGRSGMFSRYMSGEKVEGSPFRRFPPDAENIVVERMAESVSPETIKKYKQLYEGSSLDW